MQKSVFALALGAALAGGPALAAPADYSPEAYAYMGFTFGARGAADQGLSYGLRLDHDRRYLDERMPSIFQLDMAATGLATAKISGLPFARHNYRLQQAEDAGATVETAADGDAVEAEDDGGFFSGIGDMFSGLGEGTGKAILAGGAAVALILLSTDADSKKPTDGALPDEPDPADDCSGVVVLGECVGP